MLILSPWPWELDEVLQNFTYINGRHVIYLSHLALSENQGTQGTPNSHRFLEIPHPVPIKKTIRVHAHDETNPNPIFAVK
jgi:hypothetical protein